MKTLRILSLLLIAGVLFSCQKDVEPVDDLVEVSFGINQVDPVVQKSDPVPGLPELPDCSNFIPKMAQATITGTGLDINGQTYDLAVFEVNGRLYTQTIKLPPGDYSLEFFVLYEDKEMTKMVMAAPYDNSSYATWVAVPLPVAFTIATDKTITKLEVPVDVLCFEEAYYEYFGFRWFGVDKYVVRKICFFGDICLKNFAAYEGSWYDQDPDNPGGLMIDMPVITKIEMSRAVDNVFLNYDDTANPPYLPDQPLCVTYVDNPDVDNQVIGGIKLSVWVNNSGVFEWVLMGEFELRETPMGWNLHDENGFKVTDIGEDGVYDFVVGTCNYDETDIQFAPWQVLPETATANITYTNYNEGGYWLLDISAISPNGTYFDFPTSGQYLGWCGDPKRTISGSGIVFNLYSSLYPLPSGTPFILSNIAKVNWLFNNLENLEDFDGINLGYPALSGMFVEPADLVLSPKQSKDLQHAIWLLLGFSEADIKDVIGGTGEGGPSVEADALVDAAKTHYDFLPLPGEFAAVLMVKDANSQLIFTMVDP